MRCSRDDMRICLAITALIFLITGVILFSVSFDTLEPTQVGIRYNNNFVTIDESKTYNNGRYFVGLGQWFIKFPVGIITVYFTNAKIMRCWSAEGQALSLDIDLSYRLDRGNILNIYRRYGKDWDAAIEYIAAREIKQVASLYTAEQFFSQRYAIGLAMKNAVRTRLRSEFMLLEIFNLHRIYLPKQFEDKILAKVVQAQLRETAINQAAIDRLRAQIDVIRGDGEAQVTRVIATANSNSRQTIEKAKSDGARRLREAEAASYRLLQNALGLNSTTLLQYRWAQIMSDIESSLSQSTNLRFTVGFNSANVQFG